MLIQLGLCTTFSGHDVAKKQMKSFSGMIAFEMKGGLEPAKRLVEVFYLILPFAVYSLNVSTKSEI